MRVLVTGATGYIGGRLVPRLLEAGHCVRVLVRDARRIAGRPWADHVEVVVGDLLDPDSLAPALADVDAAYYLVHAMYGGGDFARRDREAADHFVAAAQVSDTLRHVIYLGGLMPGGGDVRASAASPHLASRAEVGRILRDRLPTTELRAGPIIGSGSASFEMVRYLTERLPVMVAPRWIDNLVQPIGVRAVLAYLLAALEIGPAAEGGTDNVLGVIDIGGDRLTFRQMMQGYAQVRGLRRRIVAVPVLAPGLAARWVGAVTPIPNRLAVPLVEGMVKPLVADTARAHQLFPHVRPVGYRESVERALQRSEAGGIETRWSGALGEARTFRLEDWENLIREQHTRLVAASPQAVFDVFTGLGGQRGWLVWNWAWSLRGGLDRLVGGPGLRRGRRDPRQLLAGEAVDFWRVEAVEPSQRLLLRAEMKVPGRAWLQWEARAEDGGCRLIQTALFEPRGLGGILYWRLLYPVHRMIFKALIDAIARAATSPQQST
jgi:uncharacterized protein YbjT (DUF2867 family)